jgi:hypothetical protein
MTSQLAREENVLFRLSRWLDRFALIVSGGPDSPGWKSDIRIGTFAFLVSIFLAAPALWIYLEPGAGGRLADFMAQAAEPLRRDLKEPILGYRIAVPLINYLLGLRGYAVVMPAIAASFINLMLCCRIFRLRTQSALLTFFGTVGISLTFFIVEGTTFWSAPDSVAHLIALTPAAFSLHWVYWIAGLPVAMFVDERSLIAFCFLLLFCWRRDGHNLVSHGAINAVGFLVGLSVWKLGRTIIDSGLIAEPPSNNLVSGVTARVLQIGSPHDGWAVWMVNILCAFKWMYVFPLVLSVVLLSRLAVRDASSVRGPMAVIWILNLALFIAWLGAAAFNGDVWRTISFAFFFVIEAVLMLSSMTPLLALRLARASMLLMISTPVAYVGSALTPQLSPPLPLVLWRTFAGGGAGFMIWLRSLL